MFQHVSLGIACHSSDLPCMFRYTCLYDDRATDDLVKRDLCERCYQMFHYSENGKLHAEFENNDSFKVFPFILGGRRSQKDATTTRQHRGKAKTQSKGKATATAGGSSSEDSDSDLEGAELNKGPSSCEL